MNQKIIILVNGNITDLAFHKKICDSADMIICADGGAEHAREMEIIPHLVIGDFDSISVKTREYFEGQKKTEVIEDPDQNKTDTQVAIEYALKQNPIEIIFLGAIGDRMDHTLANIFCLAEIPKNIDAVILNEKNEIRLVREEVFLNGEKNDTISTLALSEVKGLSYENMKWDLQEANVPPLWIGVCNKSTEKTVKIKLMDGLLLVIKAVD